MTMIPEAGQSRNLSDRVAAGAKLLDKRLPGWHRRIVNLDMGSASDDVLGQLYGSYYFAIDYLKLWDATDDYGFDVHIEDVRAMSEDDLPSAFAALTDAWLAEITKRLEAE